MARFEATIDITKCHWPLVEGCTKIVGQATGISLYFNSPIGQTDPFQIIAWNVWWSDWACMFTILYHSLCCASQVVGVNYVAMIVWHCTTCHSTCIFPLAAGNNDSKEIMPPLTIHVAVLLCTYMYIYWLHYTNYTCAQYARVAVYAWKCKQVINISVTVPCRNRRLFRRVCQSHCCVCITELPLRAGLIHTL